MNVFSGLHGVAAAGAERLVYSVIAGTLLAGVVWFLLLLFPRRDSRTSFAVWFSTLLATAMLPFVSLLPHSTGAGVSHSVVTISISWASYILGGWAVIALVGLARVALATIQVRKLRNEAVALDLEKLPSDLQVVIQEFQRSRPVAVMVSQKLEVPTAIGFRKPAILLPAWLLESTSAEELKYIVLHELAHLRRRDDWTNLAQKVLKALLFFLPSVWWIERRLSLDREVACDDAVLAQSGTPLGYAKCLARVAERSFIRRQLALAQAAVGRMRQLTSRVAVILDPNRPRQTRLWKPAVPVVIVVAGLCALPASFTPSLISFADAPAAPQMLSAQQHHANAVSLPHSPVMSASAKENELHMVQASLKTGSDSIAPIAVKSKRAAHRNAGQPRIPTIPKPDEPAMLATSFQAPEQPQYVTVREEMYFVVTEQTASGEQQSWQMHVVQVSLQPQAKPVPKPRKI